MLRSSCLLVADSLPASLKASRTYFSELVNNVGRLHPPPIVWCTLVYERKDGMPACRGLEPCLGLQREASLEGTCTTLNSAADKLPFGPMRVNDFVHIQALPHSWCIVYWKSGKRQAPCVWNLKFFRFFLLRKRLSLRVYALCRTQSVTDWLDGGRAPKDVRPEPFFALPTTSRKKSLDANRTFK